MLDTGTVLKLSTLPLESKFILPQEWSTANLWPALENEEKGTWQTQAYNTHLWSTLKDLKFYSERLRYTFQTTIHNVRQTYFLPLFEYLDSKTLTSRLLRNDRVLPRPRLWSGNASKLQQEFGLHFERCSRQPNEWKNFNSNSRVALKNLLMLQWRKPAAYVRFSQVSQPIQIKGWTHGA